MKDIPEIQGAISKFRNDVTWIRLRDRWDADFNLGRLEPYDAGKNYFSYTSNSPANLANKGINMLTDAKLLIHIPEDTLQKDEVEIANNIERFNYGVLGINDDRLLMLDLPPIQDQMAWMAIYRGAVVINAYVYKDESNETAPLLRIWDIYNTAFGKGKKGLSWAAYTRTATRDEIQQTYNYDIGKAETTIVEFFDTEKHGIYCDNHWLVPLEDHDVGECPVYIVRTGAQPPISQLKYTYTNIHRGESIFSSNRNLYAIQNKTVSDYVTIARRGVMPPLGYWSADGEETLDEDIWQVEHGKVISLQADEKIEPLLKPTSPVEAKEILSFVSSEIQRGGISHIAQGELGFRLSGFAINQLQASLATLITPFVKCVERAMLVGLYSLQRQYIKGGWNPVEVRGRTSKDQPFGVPAPITIKPSDLKEWRPEIILSPIYPKDDAQKAQLARMVTEGETPLLSVDTAQTEIMGIRDSKLEQEKIAKQWADNLPILRLFDAFDAALSNNDLDRAYNIVAELRVIMAQRGGSGASPRQGRNMQSILGQASMENVGTGIPSGETGVSSNTMPSEMTGGFPGGATNAGASNAERQLPLV